MKLRNLTKHQVRKMKLKHHYPYPSKHQIFDDRSARITSRFKRLFPQEYTGDKLQGRAYHEFTKQQEAFIAAHIAEESPQRCFHYLKLAHQFCQAHFRLALNPDVDLLLTLDGEQIPATGKNTLDYMSVNEWHRAFCMALVMRDNEALIGTLCRFKAEDHINPQEEDLPIDYPYCAFLQGLFNPEAGLQGLLQEIGKLSAPEYMPQRRQSYIYNIWLPFIELILAVLARDEARYHQAIEKALLSNHSHFSQEQKKDIAEGWLPMHICAAAVMAYDQCGFKLPFSSPYLPQWLIYGDFDFSD